jgi:hypothetical protein
VKAKVNSFLHFGKKCLAISIATGMSFNAPGPMPRTLPCDLQYPGRNILMCSQLFRLNMTLHSSNIGAQDRHERHDGCGFGHREKGVFAIIKRLARYLQVARGTGTIGSKRPVGRDQPAAFKAAYPILKIA